MTAAVTTSGGEVAFTTSGTSGHPVPWVRTEAQLRREALLVAEQVLGLRDPVDAIVCFAPPTHLYGYLYGRVLPSLIGVRAVDAWADPLRLPPLTSAPTLLVCVPSTWTLLERAGSYLDNTTEVIALHSTAPPPPAAHRVAARHARHQFRATELLGSTETGAVAHRAITAHSRRHAPWTLLPDVDADLSGGAERLLTVASPRLARHTTSTTPPDHWTMPDLVRPYPRPGRFVRVGRTSDIVKINGRRCLLPHLEAVVRSVAPVRDVAALPVDDSVTGEHYEIYFATDDDDLDASHLTTRLSGIRVDGNPLPLPRAVHRVAAIPRSPVGKVRRHELTDSHRPGAHR